jgi:predicted 3-demethylubiquinone-9 3-methyltransferase (glyoxalase superfamily)
MVRQKVTPFLWFDTQAEEAAAFYVSLFPDSAITGGIPGPGGKPLVVEFTLAGVQFMAINGGPHYQLTEAFSMSIDCNSQAEVDDLWEKLLAGGGTPSRCGWLKDRFGLSWQVVPSVFPKLIADPDPARAGRAMQAMMGMVKLDIQTLLDAVEGK